MRSWMIAFALGVGLAGLIPALPAGNVYLLCLLPFLLSTFIPSLRLAGAYGLGIAWCIGWGQQATGALLPHHLEGEDLWVRGTVTGLPRPGDNATRVTLALDQLCRSSDCLAAGRGSRQGRVLINDYAGLDLASGQRWQLQVRLVRPHGFANPGGFDYEAWLLQQGVIATGYIRAHAGNRRAEAPSRQPGLLFDHARLAFSQRLAEVAPRRENFIKALTIGDRYSITDREWDLLSATGTNHLMVISGLHIGLVSMLVFHLGRLLWQCFPVLLHRIPSQRPGAVLAVLAAFFYAGLAGFSLPVQRALIMVACFMAGTLFGRQTAPTNSLCLALFCIVLLDPLSLQTAGFWLSFGAVSVLLLACLRQGPPPDALPGAILPWRQRVRSLLTAQVYLFLGMAPLLMLLFHQVSLLAPLVNLVAIPLVGMVVVPLCLVSLVSAFTVPPVFAGIVSLPDYLLDILLNILDRLTQALPLARLGFPAYPIWLVVFLGGLAVTVLLLRGTRRKTVAGLLAGVLLCYRGGNLPAGEFTLDILDVGQGLAVLVTTRQHMLIFDTGPAYSARFNAGSGVLVPFIQASNLPDPDTILVSHGDNDHAGGLAALASRYPDSRLLFSEALPGWPEADRCRQGQHWQWDGVDFRILHPDHDAYRRNDGSCVLKITAGDTSVLLPGDIEAAGERALVLNHDQDLRADILVAPHHGSLTSSSIPFINRVAPDFLVFTTGYRNRFGHPHPRILQRFQRRPVKLLNTAYTGRIRFHVSPGNGVGQVGIYRLERRRFWSEIALHNPTGKLW